MNRRHFLRAVGLSAAALAAPSMLNRCTPAKKKPNIVFFLVDDLGWTDIGAFGSSFYETPNIDKLAESGMKFTDAYAACPVCSPTRASIMSGKYPARINLTDWIPGRQAGGRANESANKVVPPDFQLYMSLDEVTIAEALKEAGYSTGFLGKWHLGQSEDLWPEFQGFDVNKGGWSRGAPYYRTYDPDDDDWHGDSGYVSPYKNPRLEDGPPGEYLTDRLADETIKFVREHQEQPFFAYLSFYTVHNPMHGKVDKVEKYQKKAERLGLYGKKTFDDNPDWAQYVGQGQWRERLIQSHAEYAAMVESLDENVGKVLDELEALGLADDTIIFFMGDNGGLSTSEGSPTSNLPLRAGKGWLYEGGIREPMIVRWPGQQPGECSEPVTSTDFYPTILEMAGLPKRPEQHVDGKSLAPLVKGKSMDRGPIFWHYPHYSNQGGKPGGAVRDGDWKLIERYETGGFELYNLKEDIGEKNNLAEEMPDKVTELSSLLKAWYQETDAQMPMPVGG